MTPCPKCGVHRGPNISKCKACGVFFEEYITEQKTKPELFSSTKRDDLISTADKEYRYYDAELKKEHKQFIIGTFVFCVVVIAFLFWILHDSGLL